jgi:hypothetical protein
MLRQRMNLLAIGLSCFLPWILFCLLFAMLSFSWHYSRPHICEAVVAVLGVVIGIMLIHQLLGAFRRFVAGEASTEAPSWGIFFWGSMMLALLLAVYFGNRNFWKNMQPYSDLRSLSDYNDVDPALQYGQEYMDAATVIFAQNVTLDFRKAASFKNSETYCVVPITGGILNNVPLNSYDFWAVGKNCCSGSKAGPQTAYTWSPDASINADGAMETNFQCGDMNSEIHGGVRVVHDDDRAFYRLAVQQAESSYAIKAIHPLFFKWVSDPPQYVTSYRKEAYRVYLIGMIGYIGFQFILVFGHIFLIKENLLAQ